MGIHREPSIHLRVNLNFSANTHESSISEIRGNSIASSEFNSLTRMMQICVKVILDIIFVFKILAADRLLDRYIEDKQ